MNEGVEMGVPPLSGNWIPASNCCFNALTGEAPPRDDIPPVALVRPDVPPSVAQVMDKALHHDPTQRFGSVASMIRWRPPAIRRV